MTAKKSSAAEEDQTTEEMIEGAIDIAKVSGTLFGVPLVSQVGTWRSSLKESSPQTRLKCFPMKIVFVGSRRVTTPKRSGWDEKFGKTTDKDGKLNKEIQKKKWAGLQDRLRSELGPLGPDLKTKVLKEINPPDFMIKGISHRQ